MPSSEHIVNISGLSSNTEYPFSVIARDSYGNRAVSNITSFRTLGYSYGMQLYTYANSTLLDYGETEILINGCVEIDSRISDYVDGNIEAVVVTNPNRTASLSNVLGNYTVDVVYSNGELSESSYFTDFMVELSLIDVDIVRRADIVRCGDISLDFYHPDNLLDSVDNNSLVFGFYYGSTYVLFVDDINASSQLEMVASVIFPDVDVLISFGEEIDSLFAKHIGASFDILDENCSIDIDDNGFMIM